MATIIKLKDDKFFGKHPNEIKKGFTITVDVPVAEPIVGMKYHFGRLTTSIVTEVIEFNKTKCAFKTKDSTYKIEL